jgi:hypothetical protein
LINEGEFGGSLNNPPLMTGDACSIMEHSSTQSKSKAKEGYSLSSPYLRPTFALLKAHLRYQRANNTALVIKGEWLKLPLL